MKYNTYISKPNRNNKINLNLNLTSNRGNRVELDARALTKNDNCNGVRIFEWKQHLFW